MTPVRRSSCRSGTAGRTASPQQRALDRPRAANGAVAHYSLSCLRCSDHSADGVRSPSPAPTVLKLQIRPTRYGKSGDVARPSRVLFPNSHSARKSNTARGVQAHDNVSEAICMGKLLLDPRNKLHCKLPVVCRAERLLLVGCPDAVSHLLPRAAHSLCNTCRTCRLQHHATEPLPHTPAYPCQLITMSPHIELRGFLMLLRSECHARHFPAAFERSHVPHVAHFERQKPSEHVHPR